MMVIALALGSALLYGLGDFLGGAASRRATALAALFVALPTGLVLLLVAAAAVEDGPTRGALSWGFASGLAGGTGLIVFYRALARDAMSVVAPVSALVAAVLPVLVGTLGGERLAPVTLAGVALCVVAVAFVSMEESTREGVPRAVVRRRRLARMRGLAAGGAGLAAVSGLCFGLFFVLVREAGADRVLWPLVAARSAGVLVVATVVLARVLSGAGLVGAGSVGLLGSRTTAGFAVAAGALDVSANLLYLVAAKTGMLSLAAALTALYPAVTVLLARVVYRERLRSIQRVGLALAGVGVVLVTVG